MPFAGSQERISSPRPARSAATTEAFPRCALRRNSKISLRQIGFHYAWTAPDDLSCRPTSILTWKSHPGVRFATSRHPGSGCGLGFHSRARFCSSAICAGVIFAAVAIESGSLTTSSRLSFDDRLTAAMRRASGAQAHYQQHLQQAHASPPRPHSVMGGVRYESLAGYTRHGTLDKEPRGSWT